MSFDSPRCVRPFSGLGAVSWPHVRSVLSRCGLLALLAFAVAGAATADTFEPNNTPQQATPIQNGQQLESFISSDADEDWYGFTLAQASPIIVTVSSVPPSEGIDYDVVLVWFDPQSQLYVEIDGSFAPGGQDELIQHDNTKSRTGSFYIVVYKYEDATFDPNDSYFVALTTGGGGGNQPPTITLTAPNGGESYAAGSQHNVTWTASDPDNAPQPTSVSLEYSTNAGTSWTAIGTATGAAGSFAWTVPNTPSTQAKVRSTVSDGSATAQDESNATFTITGQPSGQNVLAIGSASGAPGATVTVSVSLDNDDVVKGYQTDIGFDAAVLLFQSATATGRGATMPASAAVVGGNKVRLIQFFQDASTLAAGTGAVCNVTFQIIATGATTTALTPTATILSDAAGGSLDVSATGGTITVTGGGGGASPVVSVSAPNGGETWASSSTHAILFSATDADTPSGNLTITLEYSTNGGTSWTQIAGSQPNNGSYTWTVPTVASNQTQSRVRVTANDGQGHTGSDQSDANFTIQAGAGGQNVLSMGTNNGASGTQIVIPLRLNNQDAVKALQTDITFDPAVVSFVSGVTSPEHAPNMGFSASVIGGTKVRVVMFYTDASVISPGNGAIANLTWSLIGANGTHSDLTPTASVLSDAQSQSLPVVEAAGSADIAGGGGNTAPTVSVSAPNGGESFASGTTQTITWTATDTETPPASLVITIELSTNGGSTFTSVANNEANDGSHTWTVPATATTQGRIRVTARDAGGLSGNDASNANFTITSTPTGRNVLSMSTGSGASGTQVVIPLRLNNQDAVKALQSDITFDPTIVGFVSGVTAPEHAPNMGFSASVIGGNKVRVVMFYTDASVISVGDGAIANLTWNLLGANGTQSALTPTATVLSDAQSQALPVTEQAGSASVGGGGGNTAPTVSVSAPNGGESFASGTTQTITWTATDTETPPASLVITIELSTNGGSTFTSVANNEANDGSFTWTVPATATTQGRIRVSARDAGGLSGNDTSNANFTITTGPAEGNVLSMGTGSGASGAQVVVALNLANEDAVKAIQSDIQFDPTVVSFVSGAVTGRGEGMSFSASVVGGNAARLVMVFTDTRTIPAGQGAVANLTFNLIGANGTQSTLDPSNTILADAQAQELPSSDEAGLIQVTGGGGQGPTLHVFALKNPGRTRTLQIFVRASTPLTASPTVTAGTTAVSMSLLDGAENLYHGVVHVPGGTANVTISASGQNANGTGTGQASVTF